MKIKKFYSILIVVLSVFAIFMGTNFIQSNKVNHQNDLKNAVESNNNYVIQNSIITPKKLQEIMDNTDVKILYIQSNGGLKEYIPNTRIIKYNEIVKTENGIPGMLADKGQIEKAMSRLGIRNDDTIIIYDEGNTPYATRLFWTLKAYGHEYAKILNGGLDAWVKAGNKTDNPLVNITPTEYSATKNPTIVATLDNIKEALKNNDEIILDVRSKAEYNKGHIPTAISVPYKLAINEKGTFKSYQQLQKIYEPLGITKDKTAIYVYCMEGNRTTFIYFVLHELMGYNNVKVYDGSYAEYLKSGLPIES